MSIADYCTGMERREIVVNRDYQRSDEVWPLAARSFLIETILLGYPIPKFWLHQITDLRTRISHKEIVDGQQRSRAILDFSRDELRLSRTLALDQARGKVYGELDPDLQGAFVTYALAIDTFVGVAHDEVREVFRRMNSYTAPLNPEEQRHATHQGPFKWFILGLSRDYSQALLDMGVFGQRELVRMSDAKLFTEVTHALANGVKTTDKRSLDSLYRSRDAEFAEEEDWNRRIRNGLDALVAWADLRGTALMRPYNFYSLMLATMHAQEPIDKLSRDIRPTRQLVDEEQAVINLARLSEIPTLRPKRQMLVHSDLRGFGGFIEPSLVVRPCEARRVSAPSTNSCRKASRCSEAIASRCRTSFLSR